MKRFFALALTGLMGITYMNAKQLYNPDQYKNSEFGSKVYPKHEGYTLIGADTADADAVRVLRDAYPNVASTPLYIGERGDEAVKDVEDQIPDHSQGYYLSIQPDAVYIAGNDPTGTFYGVQTFLDVNDPEAVYPTEIRDWPSTPNRGVVEGFYGNAWSFEDRASQFEFYGRHKLDTYIYGPKDDPYHRSRWREPYPEKEAENIRRLVELASRNKVNFVWSLHPAGDHSWDEADNRAAIAKMEQLYGLGVRHFAVFFDDVFGDHADGKQHKAMMDYVMDNFVRIHPDIQSLIMCPSLYNKSWVPKFQESYLQDISKMDPFIQIMWTGDKIVNMIHTSDIRWINSQIKRRPFIWHNYPVTDYCVDHLLMGPYAGNDNKAPEYVTGFTINPMEYAEASKVSIMCAAIYLWNPSGYHSPYYPWYAALRELVPDHTEAFKTFCLYNVDPGDTPHKFRLEGESPQLKEIIDRYGDSIVSYSSTGLDSLNNEFKSLEQACSELLEASPQNRLLTEIKPWIERGRLLGLRGQTAVKMRRAMMRGDKVDFNSCKSTYEALTDSAGLITSRDFPGSIKVAHPVVGTAYAEPFLKQSVEDMSEQF